MFQELSSIKSRRQKLGLKQNQLAELSGVSQSLIAKLEKGKLAPSYDIAVKIFQALDSIQNKQEKKCSDIMTKKLICIKRMDKINKAAEIMKKHSIDQLPVLDGKQVIGSISESLIFSKIMEGIPKNKVLSMQIEEIMAQPFPIVNSDMPISAALPMLKTEDAILVKENRKLAGIITKNNLI